MSHLLIYFTGIPYDSFTYLLPWYSSFKLKLIPDAFDFLFPTLLLEI
jgi:hypothetical protein